MTLEEFNSKWKKNIVRRFPGLQIDDPRVIEYCDNRFEQLKQTYPGFKCSAIHNRYGIIRCNFSSAEEDIDIEMSNEISKLLNE